MGTTRINLIKKLTPVFASKIWNKLPANIRLLLKSALVVIPITIGGTNYNLVLESTNSGCSAKFENSKGSDGQYIIDSTGDTLKMEP